MAAATKLVAAGYLLEEHLDALQAQAQAARPLFAE